MTTSIRLTNQPTPGSSCCYRAALDLAAGYCDSCGKPLLRCAAFEECGGLLSESGACPVCVVPELALDAGGVREAKVGGELSLPLIVSNLARIGRPLFVKGFWTREADGDWQAVELSWDRLDAGTTAPIFVTAKALDRAGEHQLEILIAFATRWRWREEVLAYTAGLAITVEGEEHLTVQQNIHLAAGAPQTGATIYAPFRYQSEGRAAAVESRPRVLPLTRASRLERTLALRGQAGEAAIPRCASLRWRGFEPGAAPGDGPIVTGDGLLALGRARSKPRGGSNDVRLLAASEDGALDEGASRGISRHHFGLCVENDRLVLHVESERGAWVNGRRVPPGATVVLKDGDCFSPVPRGQGLLSVTARFEEHHGVVESITLTRRPGLLGGELS